MIDVIIADFGCNFLNAAVKTVFQQFFCFFQTDINQVADWCIARSSLLKIREI